MVSSMPVAGGCWIRGTPNITGIELRFRSNSLARKAPRLIGIVGFFQNGVVANKLRKNVVVPIAPTAHSVPPKSAAKPEAVHRAPIPAPSKNEADVPLKKNLLIACALRTSTLRFVETAPPEKCPLCMLLRKALTPPPANPYNALTLTNNLS